MKASNLLRTLVACGIGAVSFASFAADDMAGMNMQGMSKDMPSMNMHDMHKEMPMASNGKQISLTKAEIKEIDPKSGMITLHHEPLDNMGMPGMVMAFKAGEPKMLTQFHAGDQVRVRVEPVNGKATIVKIVKQ
ncbi:copper-binding protein [Enterobacter hormaechei]|uniref:copper-binding protein n=1 Tax=Enterobacter hormaechei TaxID=158836 RepID=UPI0037520101